jgi:hypothetical protein
MAKPRVFAYIIASVGPNYKLRGSVPWVKEGKVFFGPCKRYMRPKVEEGDYIMGISPAGKQRRVLLWMRVGEKMTFADAYERGKTDRLFRLARRNAIHVRPRRDIEHIPGNPSTYEHIPGATHSKDWPKDIEEKGEKRDTFLVGDKSSWAAEQGGPLVTQELIEMIRIGIKGGAGPTIHNPLTQNARGKHALVTGKAAQQIIKWVPEPSKRLLSSRSRTTCHRTCSCE